MGAWTFFLALKVTILELKPSIQFVPLSLLVASWLNKSHGIPLSACGGLHLQSLEKQVVNESNQILTQKLHQYLKIQCIMGVGSSWELLNVLCSTIFSKLLLLFRFQNCWLKALRLAGSPLAFLPSYFILQFSQLLDQKLVHLYEKILA